mgnify:CR=1 FL=1
MLILDQGFVIFKESCWSIKNVKFDTGAEYKLLDDEIDCQYL